jgi:RNA polymerase sigma-70 factor (ECF subfamily)
MGETFEAYRGDLFALAYRLLGSAMDADDLVQETYLRWHTSPAAQTPERLRSLKAYLTTILTRLCLNHLQSARHRREQYVGPWLPEPIRTDFATSAGTSSAAEALDSTLAADPTADDPAVRVELAESVTLAFLVLLEQLSPLERAVLLLHDVFDYPYAEIATFLDKGEAACRQALHRAKQHLATHRPHTPPASTVQRELLTSFMQAVQGGDLERLRTLLAADVTLWADGGGQVRGAATKPVEGREAVARFSLGTLRLVPAGYGLEIAEINGQPALVVHVEAQPFVVLALEVDGAQIRAIRVIANPEKLHQI